jgi:hypothetical protein
MSEHKHIYEDMVFEGKISINELRFNKLNSDSGIRNEAGGIVFKNENEEWKALGQGGQGPPGPEGPKGDKGDTGAPGASRGFLYYRKVGLTNYEAWFTSPKAGTALAGTALVANRLYAMPFPCPKGITLDGIGVYVSTSSTLTARLGIYLDDGNCYPGSLLLDAGTIDVTTTGAKKLTISQALSENSLYWLVTVAGATPAIYCIPVAGVINILGHSSALGTAQNAGLYVAFTYGTLPATFPSSPTLITAAPIPAIFVRASA